MKRIVDVDIIPVKAKVHPRTIGQSVFDIMNYSRARIPAEFLISYHEAICVFEMFNLFIFYAF